MKPTLGWRGFWLLESIGLAVGVAGPLVIAVVGSGDSSRPLIALVAFVGATLMLLPLALLTLPRVTAGFRNAFPSAAYKEEIAAEAGRLGLTSHADNKSLLDAMPVLPLKAQSFERIFSGALNGVDVRLFDYAYAEWGDSPLWLTCAFVLSDKRREPLTIMRSSFAHRFVRFWSPPKFVTRQIEFDQRFEARGDSAELARTLTPSVQSSLLADSRVRFVQVEQGIVYCCDQVPLQERRIVLDGALRMRALIP